MKTTRAFLFATLMVSVAGIASAQGLDPVLLTKPATDSWPTYSGDYSGRRFSSLTQINQTNVKNLGLAWVSHLAPGPGPTGPFVRRAPGNPATIIGGEIEEAVPVRGARRTSGAVLQVERCLS